MNPSGSDDVMNERAATTGMVKFAGSEVRPLLSLTVTVKLKTPAWVGVPPIMPVEEFNARPGGSEPTVTIQF